jgi:hypothetical protein
MLLKQKLHIAQSRPIELSAQSNTYSCMPMCGWRLNIDAYLADSNVIDANLPQEKERR